MHETGKVVIAISVPGGRVARKTRLTKTLPVVSFQRSEVAVHAIYERTTACHRTPGGGLLAPTGPLSDVERGLILECAPNDRGHSGL